MMWVSKVPNYDAYGLFRALHSHNPFYAPLQNLMVLESFNRGLQSACGTRFATMPDVRVLEPGELGRNFARILEEVRELFPCE